MRRKVLTAIVFIASLLISVAIQGELKALPATKPAIPIIGMYAGVIDSVDEAGKDLSVKNGMEEMTFYLSDNAKIMEGKNTLALRDLKKGQEVTIEYTKEGNELIADIISVHTPKTGG